jgi:hypothetical protein
VHAAALPAEPIMVKANDHITFLLLFNAVQGRRERKGGNAKLRSKEVINDFTLISKNH